jgi:PAS domain S-box-containing protein
MASLPADSDESGVQIGADPLSAVDWAATPLGPYRAWPERLKLAADICMRSPLATALLWGPRRLLVHNSAWARLNAGHDGQGRPAAEAVGATWPSLEPGVVEVETSGEGTFVAELAVATGGDRSWWNVNLVPIAERGRVVGVLAQANDVTKTVTVERRLSYLIGLADRLRLLSDPEEVKAAATAHLGQYLGAARVGYADVSETDRQVRVGRDWTRGADIASLAGQGAPLATFGEEALTFLRAGEVVVIPDLETLNRPANSGFLTGLGVRSLITVPLVRDGGLKALLYIHEPQPRAWTRAEAAIARDTAERTWSAVVRAQAETSLRESEDHYRHAVELNPQVAWTSLPNGVLNRVASRWEEWTGTNGLAGGWREGMHPDDHERTLSEWARCLATGEPYDVEHRIRRRDGGYRWARSRAYPRRDEAGNVILWYGTTEDIDERKVAEEHQRLLINELNHRVKNTLATVQAIAFQTLKGDITVNEARGRFETRLMALSRAHNLLTEQNWGGAPLDRVVRDATEHLSGERARFDIAGDPVWLSPRAALALALALHELGTNAAKHGALSRDGGRVRVRWREEGEMLRLEWKESGGPPVSRPERRGFGSRLIERGLAADLGGTASLDFEPDGLRCRIDASLPSIRSEEPARD